MRGLFLTLLFAAPAAAHDFWIQPVEFSPEPGIETALALLVGHGADRQPSPIPPARITRFEALGPAGETVDLRARSLRPSRPGAYLLVLETDDRAQSHLPALRFNDYLAAEGLTPALQQRQRAGRTGRDGSENYRRCAKAILRAGRQGGGADVTLPSGLPLEIVPERDPSAPGSPDLPVRVLYRGSPLPGALVKLTDLRQDEQPVATARTDDRGRAGFSLPAAGAWLLTVVWTEAQPPSGETDFATIFASLSFAYPPP